MFGSVDSADPKGTRMDYDPSSLQLHFIKKLNIFFFVTFLDQLFYLGKRYIRFAD